MDKFFFNIHLISHAKINPDFIIKYIYKINSVLSLNIIHIRL